MSSAFESLRQKRLAREETEGALQLRNRELMDKYGGMVKGVLAGLKEAVDGEERPVIKEKPDQLLWTMEVGTEIYRGYPIAPESVSFRPEIVIRLFEKPDSSSKFTFWVGREGTARWWKEGVRMSTEWFVTKDDSEKSLIEAVSAAMESYIQHHKKFFTFDHST